MILEHSFQYGLPAWYLKLFRQTELHFVVKFNQFRDTVTETVNVNQYVDQSVEYNLFFMNFISVSGQPSITLLMA